jgi:hypothetical protein
MRDVAHIVVFLRTLADGFDLKRQGHPTATAPR